MIIDDQSGIDTIYDRWTEHGLSKSIEWNGRSLVLLEGDFRLHEDLTEQIHQALSLLTRAPNN